MLVDGGNTAGYGGDAPGSHVVAQELHLLYTEHTHFSLLMTQ
jgi:hypothetical protein